jgi:NAD(P)-dependent dehydrogenase (short-subunit alcohol dehydrogenase family)
MSEPRVIFVTGVSQGIGKRIVETLLQRPNHVVIGSVRDLESPAAKELQALEPGEGSKLHLVHIENTSPDDAAKAVAKIEAAGVNHIDIVIANAAACPFPVLPIETIPNADLVTAFQTNAASVLGLFQATSHLLKKSKDPRFAAFSSPAGSITLIEPMKSWIITAYCASKAAQNYIVQCLAFSQKDWLTVIATTPGNTQTEPGNWIARQLGAEKAALTIDESTTALLKIVETTSREDAQGKLISAHTGQVIPW